MNDTNIWTGTGRLFFDPDFHNGNYGPSAKIKIAVNKSTRNPQTNEWKERTEGVIVYANNENLVRQCQALKKGDTVFVQGELRTKQIEGHDGPLYYIQARALSKTAWVKRDAGRQQHQGNGQQRPRFGGQQQGYGKPQQVSEEFPY